MDDVVAEILSHPRASSSIYGSLLDWDSPVIPLVLSRGSYSSEAEMPAGSGIRWIDPATDESLVRSWASAAGAILTVEG